MSILRAAGGRGPPPTVRSIEFFAEVTPLNDNFIARAQVPLPAEGVGINFTGNVTYEWWIALSATDADNPGTVTEGSSYDTNGNIFIDRDLNNAAPAHLVGFSAGRPYLSVNVGGGAATVVSDTDLRNGIMGHVAITRESASGLIRILSGGILRRSTTGPSGSLAMPDDHVPIGTCGFSGTVDCVASDPFMVVGTEKHRFQSNGVIAVVSQMKISNNIRYPNSTYSVPASAMVNDANTLGLWNFGEQEGTTVADQSGNGQTMTLVPDANGPGWDATDPYA